MSFKGKVVLITGASSGIGAGSAVYFARHEATLVLVGRNADNLQETKENCMKVGAKSSQLLLIPADITKDAEKIITITIQKFGKLDVLVNNAGVFKAVGMLDGTLDDYDWMMNTNVRAMYILTKLAAPHLIKTQGNVVNISSVAGLRAIPYATAYSMTKAAVDQFTRCVALELAGHKVRVNAVNPAVIVTDIFNRGGMSAAEVEELYEHCKKTYPLQRPGTVEDTAEAIGFLADIHKASFITGVCLPVDSAKSIECPR